MLLGSSGTGDGTISGRVSKTAGGLACGQELVRRGDREAVSSRPLGPCVHCGGRRERWIEGYESEMTRDKKGSRFKIERVEVEVFGGGLKGKAEQ